MPTIFFVRRLSQRIQNKLDWLTGEETFVTKLEHQLNDAKSAISEARLAIQGLEIYSVEEQTLLDCLEVSYRFIRLNYFK